MNPKTKINFINKKFNKIRIDKSVTFNIIVVRSNDCSNCFRVN